MYWTVVLRGSNSIMLRSGNGYPQGLYKGVDIDRIDSSKNE